MRVTTTMIKNMVALFNQYHTVTINGRAHHLMAEKGLNGFEVAWSDNENYTLSAHVSPSTAMTTWETYLVIKTLVDNQMYVEQAHLEVKRV
jgi:hypothetical protein